MSQCDQAKRQLIDVLTSELGPFGQLRGEVFSSGLDTLQRGPLYVMGLNPGGTPDDDYNLSILRHVETWDLTNYSAFTDQCWKRKCWREDPNGRQESLHCSCTSCARGKDPQQLAIKDAIERVFPNKKHPNSVFASNAIFAASRSVDTFVKDTRYTLKQAWELCWKVHRFLLSIVRPKVVLCLGYDSFSLLTQSCERLSSPEPHYRSDKQWKYPAFKSCEIALPSEASSTRALVLGIRHPARAPRALEKLSDFDHRIASWLAKNDV